MSPFSNQTVIVTGGAGFLGSFVVERLNAAGAGKIVVPRKRDCDLRDASAIATLLAETKPDLIIHLAASVGGIGANRKHPGSFFFDNAIMGIQLIEQARLAGVKKFVCAGTICAYPKFTPVPFKEDNLWDGYPEETNAPYGVAKKSLLVQLQSYRQEYGFNGIFLLPVNLYGPRDNFDLETSHVIPAMIRKCVEAHQNNLPRVKLWGTGRPTREFLYVEDAADAIVTAAARYEKPDPVNLGSGQEIAIRDLAESIRELTGYKGQFEWDTTQPDGQPRRCLDTTRAETEFGWKSRTSLREGLVKTIDWYRQSHAP
jgi:GDP-L-fucose synthase